MVSNLSSAEICRQRGWGPYTVLVGEEGAGDEQIMITAVGDALLFATTTGHGEGDFSLKCRCWSPVPLGEENKDLKIDLKDEMERVAAEVARLESRQRALYRLSFEAPEQEKVCDDWLAEMLGRPVLGRDEPNRPNQEPKIVSRITFEGKGIWEESLRPSGCLVAVRPAGDEYGNKTFLGVLLGDIALTAVASYNRKTETMNVGMTMHIPPCSSRP